LARVHFLARIRSMARIGAVMFADRPLAAAHLSTVCRSILALTSTVAELLAEVDSAFQLLATWKSATNFGEPTRLILEGLLSTDTRLLHKERALWA
jgi:hypothetical protein